MNTVIERVEYQVVSPKRALPGLDYTLNRLDGLAAAIKRVQAQLAGLSNNAAFKLSAKQYQDRAFNSRGQAVLNVSQLARRLGFDPKDVRKTATLVETEIQSAIGKIQRAIERDPRLGKRALATQRQKIADLQNSSYFTDSSGRTLKNSTAAGKFFERYAGLALKDKEKGGKALAAILSGVVPSGGPASYGSSVTPSHLQAAIQAAVNAGKGAAAGTATEKKQKKIKPQQAHTPAGDNVIETRTVTPADPEKPVRTITKRHTAEGIVEETVHENDEELKTTVTDAIARRAKGELKEQLRQLKADFKRRLPGMAGTSRLPGLVQDITREADLLEQKYGPLGLGNLVTAFKGQTVPDVLAQHQKGQARSGASLDKQRQAATTAQFLTEYKARVAATAALDKQRNTEQTRNYLAEQKRQADASAALDKQRNRAQTQNFVAEQKQQAVAAQTAAAQMTVRQLRAAGAKRIAGGTTDAITGQVLSENYQLGGDQYRVAFGKGGAKVTKIEKPAAGPKADRLTQSFESWGGRNMAANFVKVAAWSVAAIPVYGALTKSIELAEHSLHTLIQTGSETAHLGVVFHGVGGSAQELTNDILALAAAQGRESSEAMQSATEWARLGGDRKAINEEVRVSAIAANLANTPMLETTKQLAALMHIYHLEADGLNGVLGMLVNTSLKYNVTLEDLFNGLDRSAGAAKVAGVGLAELQGMIGTVVGKTGQSGIVVGNTIKSLLVQFSNPSVQRALRGFGIETLDKNLQTRPGGQIIGDIAAKWDTMNQSARLELLRNTSGRMGAARTAPLFDDYLQTQKLAIDGQLNLNRAQNANVAILATLKAQLTSLRTEWDRMIVSSHAMLGMTATTSFARNIISDVASHADSIGLTDEAIQKNKQAVMENNPLTMNGKRGYWSTLGTHISATGATLNRTLGIQTLAGMVPWGPAQNWYKAQKMTPGLVDYFNFQHLNPAESAQKNIGQQEQELANKMGAYSKLQKYYDFVSGKLDRGKLGQEDANLATYGMTSAQSTGFLSAWQMGDKSGAQKVLMEAKEAARLKLLAATREHQTLLDQQRLDLTTKRDAALTAQTAAAKSHPQDTAKEDAAVASLNAELDRNNELSQKNATIEEEVRGNLEQVTELRQDYVNALKENADVLERLNHLSSMVSPFNQTQGLDQQYAAATMQLAVLRELEKEAAKHRNESSSAQQTWQELYDRSREAEARQFATRPGGVNRILAAGADATTLRLGRVEGQANAQAYGYDETDKLLRERQHLLGEINKLEQNTHRTAQDNVALEKNATMNLQVMLSLRQRHYEVEREIHQLAIDQNREFAKSFFGGGPAEMLKKLAAFRLAQGGGVSTGQMFSLSPGLRQDYGQLTGQNPDMWRLLGERNRLNGGVGKAIGWPDDKPGTNLFGDRFDQWLTQFSERMSKDMGGALDNASKAVDAVGKFGSAAELVADILVNKVIPMLNGQGGRVTPATTGQTHAGDGQSGGYYPGKPGGHIHIQHVTRM